MTRRSAALLRIHPLVGDLPTLAGRIIAVPLSACEPCERAVLANPRKCLQCPTSNPPLLLTEHLRGGRVFCVTCFSEDLVRWEEVQAAKARREVPWWIERDVREFGTRAQWSEDWREFHTSGLELVLMSGRVLPRLFTSTGAVSRDDLPEHDYSVPWRYNVAGHLMAGVGTEILLKGLYTKRGFSIRKPERAKPQVVAPLGSEPAKWNNPRESISFGPLLKDENLERVCTDPRAYRPLSLARYWRNRASHAPMTWSGDARVYLTAFGASLQRLHRDLLDGADAAHRQAVERVLLACRPIREVAVRVEVALHPKDDAQKET